MKLQLRLISLSTSTTRWKVRDCVNLKLLSVAIFQHTFDFWEAIHSPARWRSRGIFFLIVILLSSSPELIAHEDGWTRVAKAGQWFFKRRQAACIWTGRKSKSQNTQLMMTNFSLSFSLSLSHTSIMSTRTALKLLARSTTTVLRRQTVTSKPLLARGIAIGRLSALPQVRPTWSPLRSNGASVSQGQSAEAPPALYSLHELNVFFL
jgi:hypothetical protein